MNTRLVCPVRNCGSPLARHSSESPALACGNGHTFDLARSGYANLLQPQDRRSKHPGDSRATAMARRRITEAGHETPVFEAVAAEIARSAESAGRDPVVLDVGCGEGYFLGSLAALRPVEAHGIDISTPAVELAARRYPGATWVVGNADRALPWESGSFDVLLSITSRRNAEEFRRVLAPSGRAVVVLPADDDLIELREALLGRGALKDRVAAVVADLAPRFELRSRATVRRRVRLDADEVRDLLAATYRGGRPAERDRAASLGPAEATMSREILVFHPRN